MPFACDEQSSRPCPGVLKHWLPAPAGPIYVAMRLYWPKKEALEGKGKPPPVVRVK
jgi:hypothetical protein